MQKREAVLLILIGTFLLLLNLEIVTRNYIVFFVGLGLLILYLFDKNSGLIIPGFIVTAVGTYNILNNHFNIPRPFFLLLLGIAFLGIYFFERNQNGWAIFPGAAVSLVGLYQLANHYPMFENISRVFAPLIIIAIGLVVLIKSSKN